MLNVEGTPEQRFILHLMEEADLTSAHAIVDLRTFLEPDDWSSIATYVDAAGLTLDRPIRDLLAAFHGSERSQNKGDFSHGD